MALAGVGTPDADPSGMPPAADVAPPLVQPVSISPPVAAEVAGLPDTFHRDPADRIIVAAARVVGATLLTQDRRIVDSRLVATL